MAAQMAAPFQGALQVLAWRRLDACSGQLALTLDRWAAERVVAGWYLDGWVGLGVRGQYLVFKVDGPAGRTIRVGEPGVGTPLAWFEPRRSGEGSASSAGAGRVDRSELPVLRVRFRRRRRQGSGAVRRGW